MMNLFDTTMVITNLVGNRILMQNKLRKNQFLKLPQKACVNIIMLVMLITLTIECSNY